MKLKRLLRNLPWVLVKGPKEIEISGLCSDSRCTAPGNLFIAKRGTTTDGTLYIDQAINAGAIAILTDLYNPSLKHITQLITDRVHEAEAILANDYYDLPSHVLDLIGITGTNGKTTTSYMVKHLLDQLNGPCGLIGTIESIVGGHRYKTGLTTPDVITNQKLLREMLQHGCKSAVMEVSSHALHQDRVEGITYKAAIFTNLTPEHLDYHPNMEHYAAAKQKLFTNLVSGTAIINADDTYGKMMVEKCSTSIITYGIQQEADIMANNIKHSIHGVSCTIQYGNQTVPCHIPLIGIHNLYNFMAAIAACLPYASLETLVKQGETLPLVRGRLETVPNPLGLNIFVDYAHKDHALKTVLQAIKQGCKGRIICVFGCGGNRDRYKRPRMAQVSQELANVTIVTSDNPRSEPSQQIIDEIVVGFTDTSNVHIEPDRKEAIAYAISIAKPEDAILIAGKGHEEQQIFAHATIAFDDRAIAYELCCNKA